MRAFVWTGVLRSIPRRPSPAAWARAPLAQKAERAAARSQRLAALAIQAGGAKRSLGAWEMRKKPTKMIRKESMVGSCALMSRVWALPGTCKISHHMKTQSIQEGSATTAQQVLHYTVSC